MTVSMEEVMPTLTATKVLISILETIGKAEVPLATFIDMDADNRELEVSFDGDSKSFIFSLKEVGKEDE